MISRKVVRGVFIAVLAIVTALPFWAGPAGAAPNAGETEAVVTSGIGNVTVKIDSGSLRKESGFLVFRDGLGTILEKVPLKFVAPDDRTYPVDVAITGRSATLTPSRNPARSTATDPVFLKKTKVADEDGYRNKNERDDAALNRLNKEVATGGTVTTVIGAAIGAIIGGTAGCLLGLAAGPLGCFFAGIPLGAAAGAGVGVIMAGGVAAAAVIAYFNNISKPFEHVTETPPHAPNPQQAPSTPSTQTPAPTTPKDPAPAPATPTPGPGTPTTQAPVPTAPTTQSPADVQPTVTAIVT